MLLVIQLWGALFYLANKGFFLAAELSDGAKKKKWKTLSWWVYIIGTPAWVYLLWRKSDLIAACIELAGLPSMFMGLVNAREERKSPEWLDWLALAGVTIGICLSVFKFGGLVFINQWLELGLSVGFLIGTYLLGMKKPDKNGYLWFLAMNFATGALMWRQGYFFLALQQVASFGVVLAAFIISKVRASASTAGS